LALEAARNIRREQDVGPADDGAYACTPSRKGPQRAVISHAYTNRSGGPALLLAHRSRSDVEANCSLADACISSRLLHKAVLETLQHVH
jgi:hypothetical protein